MKIQFPAFIRYAGEKVQVEIKGTYSKTRDAYATGDSPTLYSFEDVQIFAPDGEPIPTEEYAPEEILQLAIDYMEGN